MDVAVSRVAEPRGSRDDEKFRDESFEARNVARVDTGEEIHNLYSPRDTKLCILRRLAERRQK